MQKIQIQLEFKQKPALHEKAASVNEIINLLGESKDYDYKYWLKKIGTAPFGKVLEIVKKARELDKKYSKGGYITNQLKEYAVSRSKKIT